MKQAVLYQLTSDGGQPYVALDDLGLKFDGGFSVKEGLYLGIIEGEEKVIAELLKSNEYNMQPLEQEEARQFYASCIPAVIDQPVFATKQEMIDSFVAKLDETAIR